MYTKYFNAHELDRWMHDAYCHGYDIVMQEFGGVKFYYASIESLDVGAFENGSGYLNLPW